jgi:N-acetylglucosaminylphosphatidylinositol deacetylase
MTTLSHIAWLFVLVALLTRAVQQPLQSDVSSFLHSDATETNILLLTAHPDDECMFFAPTLLGIGNQAAASKTNSRPNIYSLCLSVGNADGLGDLRREELSRSLDVLRIDSKRRQVIDRP